MFVRSISVLLCVLGLAVSSAFELGSVSGAVKDAVSDASLGGVEVKVPLWPVDEDRRMRATLPAGLKLGAMRMTDDWVYTYTTTDGQGTYSLDLPLIAGAADYDVEFSAPQLNYNPITMHNVDVRANEQTIVEELAYIDRSIGGPGVLSGLAKHAQTGRGEPGVLLHFRKGLRVRDGLVIGSVVSGTDGSWSIVLDAGSYTMQGSKDGFVTDYRNVISLGRNPVLNQDISLTPIPPPGETRIVLTWGLHPRDLDSHLTGPLPGSSERFRVYFNARGSKVTYPFSDLDVDDTSSYGPETTTITRQAAGVYRFAVHHFSGEGLMSNSGAKVTVTHAGSYREFHIPPRVPGVVWTVFELNGNSIVPINTITNNQIQ